MSSASDASRPDASRPDAARPEAAAGTGAARAAFRTAGRAVLGASALVAAEGLVLIGLGALQSVRGFGSDIDDPMRAELGALLALFGGGCLILAARALVTGQRWARSPVLVTQLLSVPVAVALIQNDLAGYGVPLAVVAGAVVVLLLAAGIYRPDDDLAD